MVHFLFLTLYIFFFKSAWDGIRTRDNQLSTPAPYHWARKPLTYLEAFLRTRSMMFCIKLTICFTFSRRIDFLFPPYFEIFVASININGRGT